MRMIAPWKLLVPAAGAALAASVALAVYFQGASTRRKEELHLDFNSAQLRPDVGLKGDLQAVLQVVAQRDSEGPFPVRDGAALRPGDKIRFVVNPGTAKYVLIASRDGSGAFNVYHPLGGTQSAAIERGLHELPGVVALDEAGGSERLVAVFSNRPMDAETLKLALEENPTAPQVPNARLLSLEFLKAEK